MSVLSLVVWLDVLFFVIVVVVVVPVVARPVMSYSE